jgi:uncharacterized membrane protein YuzA (DUF378 family)
MKWIIYLVLALAAIMLILNFCFLRKENAATLKSAIETGTKN